MKVRYTPDSADLIIKFLMQYIALLIPAIYLFYDLMLGWGFHRNLLKSKIVSEIKAPRVDFKKKKFWLVKESAKNK